MQNNQHTCTSFASEPETSATGKCCLYIIHTIDWEFWHYTQLYTCTDHRKHSLSTLCNVSALPWEVVWGQTWQGLTVWLCMVLSQHWPKVAGCGWPKTACMPSHPLKHSKSACIHEIPIVLVAPPAQVSSWATPFSHSTCIWGTYW